MQKYRYKTIKEIYDENISKYSFDVNLSYILFILFDFSFNLFDKSCSIIN